MSAQEIHDVLCIVAMDYFMNRVDADLMMLLPGCDDLVTIRILEDSGQLERWVM